LRWPAGCGEGGAWDGKARGAEGVDERGGGPAARHSGETMDGVESPRKEEVERKRSSQTRGPGWQPCLSSLPHCGYVSSQHPTSDATFGTIKLDRPQMFFDVGPSRGGRLWQRAA
jgi:hypothetical protein